MGREVLLFSSEKRNDRTRIADILRQLADKVESGSVVLRQGEDEIEVQLPESIVLEVKLEEEENGQKERSLEVELEWPEGEQASDGLYGAVRR